MATALVLAEHELSEREVTGTLKALAELRVDGEGQLDVTVLVPCAVHWPVPLMDDLAAAHGIPASWALGDTRRDGAGARAAARRVLQHVLSAMRGGGHRSQGELVAVRDVVRDLVTEAAVRGATTVLVVSSPHRVSHLLHRDLEHRLCRAGIAHVVRVHGVDETAVT
jgi:hypothetical protein